MVNQKVPQKPYRIEERGHAGGRRQSMPTLDFDDRDEALYVFNEIVHGSDELYGKRPRLRLVLLGPDRTKLPPSVVDGPAL